MQFTFKLFVLTAFIQSIKGFCIYNSLTDGTKIYVEQLDATANNGRAFKKSIDPEGKECCNFQNRDCSPHGIADEPTQFKMRFSFPRYESFDYRIDCWTGGALVMKGDENKFWAECTDMVSGFTRGKEPTPAGSTYV